MAERARSHEATSTLVEIAKPVYDGHELSHGRNLPHALQNVHLDSNLAAVSTTFVDWSPNRLSYAFGEGTWDLEPR